MNPLDWFPIIWWYWENRKEERLQSAIDAIRTEFGFTSLLKGNARIRLLEQLQEVNSFGGHSAGGIR